MATEARINKIKEVVAGRQKNLVLILDHVDDPFNVAAILRTCEAFGLTEIHVISSKDNKYKKQVKSRKTSSTAVKWVEIKFWKSAISCFKSLTKEKYVFAATALTNASLDLYETNWSKYKLALVVGNEHSGISEFWLENSDYIMKIPMTGMVQSLNVSVSTALCVAEITRQRKVNGVKFNLSALEQKKLINNYLAKK